jgi:hypothetical protein
MWAAGVGHERPETNGSGATTPTCCRVPVSEPRALPGTRRGLGSAFMAIKAGLSEFPPVLTTLFARLLLPDERLSAVGLVGAVLGLVGVAAVASPDPSALLSTSVVANLLVFLAALSFALGSVFTTRLDSGIERETMEAWSMVAARALGAWLPVAGCQRRWLSRLLHAAGAAGADRDQPRLLRRAAVCRHLGVSLPRVGGRRLDRRRLCLRPRGISRLDLLLRVNAEEFHHGISGRV